MIFSSDQKGTYSKTHVEFFRQIAGQMAAVVEKGWLHTILTEKNELIESQNQVMRQDLEMARKVQLALIPTEAPASNGLQVVFHYEPAVQVGGDLLDILALPGGATVLFVADAVGHGVQAALVMCVVKTALRAAVAADSDPSRVLQQINSAVAGMLGEHFVTAVCCRVDAVGKAELALAGHPKPLWFSSALGKILHEGNGGLPLAVMAEGEFPTVELSLGRGDALVFYTDGLTEAFNPAGEEYGCERFAAIVERHANRDAQGLQAAILGDVRAWCDGRAFSDDLTILTAKMHS